MIHVYGTSHVSHESIDRINEAVEKHDPEIVALELDPLRLQALRTGDDNSSDGGPIFIRLLRKFQNKIGSKTGLMPGQEMLYAYHKSLGEDREVVLIDQDIRTTMRKLGKVRRKEKVKASLSLLAGLVLPGSLDVSSIPDEKLVQQMSVEMKHSFPGLYSVLMEERNVIMTESLKQVQRENPDSDIVAFVGAAHRKHLEDELSEFDSQSTVEEFL
ncbi:TraB/GumN family protein [Candidatus Nanohalovita haloferacivicina]|uniref:TraB/GumN family protein n=1 Tax=Candidatus Nanohalovita haloferacivicina TaxID=2978046 RepID=UPI00325F9DD4|nr:Pheromone shutdown protein TraB [Candidatus Nanohalobia archaeon BNXNv]